MDGEVVIRDTDGTQVDRLVVGKSGQFEASLDVGTYTVQSVVYDRASDRDLVCEEARVTVADGTTAEVALTCPTL